VYSGDGLTAAPEWEFSYFPAVSLGALTKLGRSQGKGLLIFGRRKHTPSSTSCGLGVPWGNLVCGVRDGGLRIGGLSWPTVLVLGRAYEPGSVPSAKAPYVSSSYPFCCRCIPVTGWRRPLNGGLATSQLFFSRRSRNWVGPRAKASWSLAGGSAHLPPPLRGHPLAFSLRLVGEWVPPLPPFGPFLYGERHPTGG